MSEKQEKKSKQKELYDEINDVAISKQLNFLIGSGASFPAIPLMGQVDYKDTPDNIKNEKFITIIKKVSSILLSEKTELINSITDKKISLFIFSELIKSIMDEKIRPNIFKIDYKDKSLMFLTVYSIIKRSISQKKLNDMNIVKMRSTIFRIDYNDMNIVKKQYRYFLESVINVLNSSNSRQTPRSANIFTTNYDLFLETAADESLKNQRFIFNDGASGYFTRTLDGANYNKTVSYKGLNDNYINEIPSITLIKPHGSVNWNKTSDDEIVIENEVANPSFVVPPTGHEEQDTFLDNHFHEMLRIFQLELDKPQSVLFVVGFSFQDKHIAKMVKRALQNPELMVYVICFSNQDKNYISTNLSSPKMHNLKFITPGDLLENAGNHHLTLSDLTKIFQSETLEGSSDE